MVTKTDRADLADVAMQTRFAVGEHATCELTVTRQCVDAFSRFSQDTNPLHMDDAAAQRLGFPRSVAHGLIALSAISRLIGTRLPGPGALWLSQTIDFCSPVLVGDRLEARVTVERFSRGARMLRLRTEVANVDTRSQVLRGFVTVRVLEPPEPADPSGTDRSVA